MNSFFGSFTQPSFFGGSTTFTYGGGTGWFLAIVAAAFFFISTGVAFSAARRIAPLGNLRTPPQPGIAVTSNFRGMFRPMCGSHYLAGTQYCGKDATALKEIAQ